MLSTNKINALKIFVRTRLTGEYTEFIKPEDRFKSNIFVEQIVSDQVRDEVLEIKDKLTEQGYTVDVLNNMPDSVNAFYIYKYYMVMVKTYEKCLNMGNPDERRLVIEGVIGLSLLSILYEEVGINKDLDFPFMEILAKFESKFNHRRDLVFKMHKFAREIYDSLNKANFKLNTVARQNNKKKKR